MCQKISSTNVQIDTSFSKMTFHAIVENDLINNEFIDSYHSFEDGIYFLSGAGKIANRFSFRSRLGFLFSKGNTQPNYVKPLIEQGRSNQKMYNFFSVGTSDIGKNFFSKDTLQSSIKKFFIGGGFVIYLSNHSFYPYYPNLVNGSCGCGGGRIYHYPGILFGAQLPLYRKTTFAQIGLFSYNKFSISSIDSTIKYSYTVDCPNPRYSISEFIVNPFFRVHQVFASKGRWVVSLFAEMDIVHFDVFVTKDIWGNRYHGAQLSFEDGLFQDFLNPGIEINSLQGNWSLDFAYHFSTTLFSIHFQKIIL